MGGGKFASFYVCCLLSSANVLVPPRFIIIAPATISEMGEPQFLDFTLNGKTWHTYDETKLQGTYYASFTSLEDKNDAIYIAEATFADSSTETSPPAAISVLCKSAHQVTGPIEVYIVLL